MHERERITYFAETDFRGEKQRFGIKESDRARHIYIVGKTGMGKSALLLNMAIQDIHNGNGISFIDPRGGIVGKLLEYVPESRIKDIIYIAPHATARSAFWNIFECVNEQTRHIAEDHIITAFADLWRDIFNAEAEEILRNAVRTLFTYRDATVIDIGRLFAEEKFRKEIIEHLPDHALKVFWENIFSKEASQKMRDTVETLTAKMRIFIADPIIRGSVGNARSSFDILEAMDAKKVLLADFAVARIGEEHTRFLGKLFIAHIHCAMMARMNAPAGIFREKPHHYLFADECQLFSDDTFGELFVNARRAKLDLTVTHQYLEQLSEHTRTAIWGSVGTIIVFRLGSFDAEIFEKEFAPHFTAEELADLRFAEICLKLTIDGVSSKPFLATTLPTIAPAPVSFKERVLASSQALYAQAPAPVAENRETHHRTAISPTASLDVLKKEEWESENKKRLRELLAGALAEQENNKQGIIKKQDDKSSVSSGAHSAGEIIDSEGVKQSVADIASDDKVADDIRTAKPPVAERKTPDEVPEEVLEKILE